MSAKYIKSMVQYIIPQQPEIIHMISFTDTIKAFNFVPFIWITFRDFFHVNKLTSCQIKVFLFM